MDVGIEGYLYEPEKSDYLNMNQIVSDSNLSSDTEGEIVHYPETCARPSTRTPHNS